MRGDLILFYSSGSLMDRLIEWATKGPFTHVAIDLGDGKVIEATGKGVGINPIDAGRKHVFVSPATSAANKEAGIAWLKKQVGDPYSYGDIFSDTMGFLGWRVVFGQPGTFDCSNLATHYLIVANAATMLGSLADTPDIVSPNDIARASGILKR